MSTRSILEYCQTIETFSLMTNEETVALIGKSHLNLIFFSVEPAVDIAKEKTEIDRIVEIHHIQLENSERTLCIPRQLR